jgi:hypothetical protein
MEASIHRALMAGMQSSVERSQSVYHVAFLQSEFSHDDRCTRRRTFEFEWPVKAHPRFIEPSQPQIRHPVELRIVHLHAP